MESYNHTFGESNYPADYKEDEPIDSNMGKGCTGFAIAVVVVWGGLIGGLYWFMTSGF